MAHKHHRVENLKLHSPGLWFWAPLAFCPAWFLGLCISRVTSENLVLKLFSRVRGFLNYEYRLIPFSLPLPLCISSWYSPFFTWPKLGCSFLYLCSIMKQVYIKVRLWVLFALPAASQPDPNSSQSPLHNYCIYPCTPVCPHTPE